MADIFTKPFTDRSKWQHALRLIAHTDAFHTSKVARGNPKPTETAAAPAKETTPASEELAKSLLKSKDFTYDALEELLQSMFAAGKRTFRAMQQRDKRSQHLVFGAFAHGPFCGVMNRTLLYPTCVKYINQFLAKQLPKTMTWSTFALSSKCALWFIPMRATWQVPLTVHSLWAKAKVVVYASKMRGVIVPSKPSRARTSKSSCATPAASLFVFLRNSTMQCNHGQGFDFLWLVTPRVLCLT